MMRPVIEGVMSMADLHSDKLGLYDVGLVNDALDVRAENEHRAVKGA